MSLVFAKLRDALTTCLFKVRYWLNSFLFPSWYVSSWKKSSLPIRKREKSVQQPSVGEALNCIDQSWTGVLVLSSVNPSFKNDMPWWDLVTMTDEKHLSVQFDRINLSFPLLCIFYRSRLLQCQSIAHRADNCSKWFSFNQERQGCDETCFVPILLDSFDRRDSFVHPHSWHSIFLWQKLFFLFACQYFCLICSISSSGHLVQPPEIFDALLLIIQVDSLVLVKSVSIVI